MIPWCVLRLDKSQNFFLKELMMITLMAWNTSCKSVKYLHLWNYNLIGIAVEITMFFTIEITGTYPYKSHEIHMFVS